MASSASFGAKSKSLRKIGYGAFEAMPAAPDIPKGAQVDAPRAFSSAR